MKRIGIGLLLVLSFSNAFPVVDPCCKPCKVVCQPIDCCACKVTSHTFFSARPLFQVATPEYESLFRDRMHVKTEGHEGAIQVVPFGSRSTESARLATFFTPFCTSTLIVDEQELEDFDIVSQYLNVNTINGTFRSKIQFCPKRTEAGIGLSYKQAFHTWEDGRSLWVAVVAPITHVKSSMGLCEEILDDGGGVLTDCLITMSREHKSGNPCCAQVAPDSVDHSVGSVTQAFRQPEWHCGKIDCRCELAKTRIANLDLLLGYEIVDRERCYIESFFGFSFPTGNRVKNEFVFEPIVGYNHHYGVMGGTSAGLQLWADEEKDKHLWFHLAMRGLYLIHNCQPRLVDLKFKPWSRYMRVFKDQQQAQQASDTADACLHTPGVNVFCLDLIVHPGLQRTYNNALTYTSGSFQGEIGYNFFYREAECVELKCPWQEGPALIALFNGQSGQTDSVQMINNSFGGANIKTLAEYNENIIKQCDLDLESAAHPLVATHTIYGSVGWRFDDREYPPFFGFGGSYEFADENVALNRWVLWGKAGLSF